jgi:hypothetical protein
MILHFCSRARPTANEGIEPPISRISRTKMIFNAKTPSRKDAKKDRTLCAFAPSRLCVKSDQVTARQSLALPPTGFISASHIGILATIQVETPRRGVRAASSDATGSPRTPRRGVPTWIISRILLCRNGGGGGVAYWPVEISLARRILVRRHDPGGRGVLFA